MGRVVMRRVVMGRAVMGRVPFVTRPLTAGWLGTPPPGRIGDDGIEPLADRHAGTTRGVASGLTCPRPDPFYMPRKARFHARIRMLDRKVREAPAPLWNRRLLRSDGRTEPPYALGRSFPVAVNERLRLRGGCAIGP